MSSEGELLSEGIAPNVELGKKVWRSAVSPPQILGRSGMPDGGVGCTAWRCTWEGNIWYLPSYPVWALKDSLGECPYIAKACERYGVKDHDPARLRGLLHFQDSDTHEVAAPAGADAAEELTLVDGKTVVAVFDFGGESYTAAPVAYLLRRYGVDGELRWMQSEDGILSAWLHGGWGSECVGLIQRWR